jgi:ABC-2 type transport system ATP-binding protein
MLVNRMETAQTFPSEPVVQIDGLSCQFGSLRALDNIALAVPRGGVYGLVGQNGAGKTTLIKHILGLMPAQQGSIRVFGRNPVAESVAVLGRIGYVSENRELPVWMRLAELMRYTAAFYPAWDFEYAEHLREQLGLDPAAKVKNLSLGQKAKACLLLAQAHRPDLLVLDEPSSGLDPVVRRDILEAIIRLVAHEGRTVFFSSHLLDEVERVSDRVTMIHGGRVVLGGSLDEIKRTHGCLRLRFRQAQAQPPLLPGAVSVMGGGTEWLAVFQQRPDDLAARITALEATVIEDRIPSLDEIFVAWVGQNNRPRQEEP